jgi:microsomal dipeptidase-like Zn-dependent dipeptidase
VDLPRLREGHVAVQAFTIVTKVPRHANIERNDDTTDDITLLAAASRWPARTWMSLRERALYQALRLRTTAARSQGGLVLLKGRTDLEAFLQRREREPELLAGFLGIEGAHALEGDLASLDVLFEAGVRMIAPTHFFDNDIGGSAHGVTKGGLTSKGRDLIRRMEERGVLLDLAHASAATIADALALARRPIVVSHTGVRATCDNARNLSDQQLRGIAGTGGVIGIGYWETAVCGRDGRAVARAIRHAADVAGVDHVALGSDFDGSIEAPFDTAGLVEITDGLLAEGFGETEVAQIMGGNALRVLRSTLP